MKDVIALMLAGGRVDAMGVLTAKRSMAAVPCLGLFRIVDFPLTNLLESGVNRVGILSQYRPASLMDHVGIGKPWDFNGRSRHLSFLPPYEGQEAHDWYRGTADAVYQNLHFIERHRPRDVLVMSADHVYRMHYGPLVDFHRRSRADLTMVFKPMETGNPSRFGVGVLGEKGRVLRYLEKPADPPSNLASLTIYVFRAEALIAAVRENAASGSTFHLYDEVIPGMVAGARVFGRVFRGGWEYMRPLSGYHNAHMRLLAARGIRVPLDRVLTNLEEQGAADAAPAWFGPGADVRRSFVAPGCRVAGRVRDSVLFPGVTVEDGAAVEDSVLLHKVTVHRDARIRRCVADKLAIIGEGADADGAGELVAIAKGAVIPAGAMVGPGTVMPAGKAPR